MMMKRLVLMLAAAATSVAAPSLPTAAQEVYPPGAYQLAASPTSVTSGGQFSLTADCGPLTGGTNAPRAATVVFRFLVASNTATCSPTGGATASATATFTATQVGTFTATAEFRRDNNTVFTRSSVTVMVTPQPQTPPPVVPPPSSSTSTSTSTTTTTTTTTAPSTTTTAPPTTLPDDETILVTDTPAPTAGGTFTATTRCVVPELVEFTFLDQTVVAPCRAVDLEGFRLSNVVFNGIAEAQFRAPAQAGAYTVTARLTQTGITLDIEVKVATPSGTIPATGAGNSSRPLALMAAGLAGAGTAMVLTARRRRRKIGII